MRVLDRKLLREIRSTKGLLLAIVSIIGVGVACYVAMGSSYRNLSIGQQRYYAQCRMADFSLQLKKAPLSEIESIASLPGVKEIRARIQSYATVDIEGATGLLNGSVLSLPDQRRPVINDIVLRQGSYFTNRRANEVIVNEAFARFHNLYPGQWIHLLLNNRRQELFIVGTAISSEFTYLLGPSGVVPDPEHFGVFYIKRTFAEEVLDYEGAANEVLGLATPALRENPRRLLDQAEQLLEPYGVFSTTPLADQPSHRFLDNEIEGLRSFGWVMPAIFLAVAAIVLNMVMTRLAEQQRVVVGTLKALGYENRQVFAHFVKYGVLVGLVGGVLGCLGGYWMAEGMTTMYRQFFEFPELVNRMYADTYLIGIAISVACGLVGSLHGARNVLKLAPAEAMRPKPPAQGGAIWLERFAGFWRQLSFGWRVTLRNAARHRVRTTASVFAACMGAAVCVNSLMMAEATHYLIDFQFFQIQRSDIDLAFEEARGLDALAEVRHLPGVDLAEPQFNVACTLTNGPYQRKAAITGLVRGAQLTIPRDIEGRPIVVPEVGLVMTRKIAELLHLRRGDMVEMRPVRGLRQTRRVPVVNITDSYIGLAVYADIEYLSRLVNEEYALSGVQLKVHPSQPTQAALYRRLKELPAIQGINNRHESIENLMETLVKNQSVFISLLVGFAGVIFFGSVLNSSLISLAERQREVATLRVLGYSPWQVGGLFLRESLLTNLVGTLLGLPLGWLLSQLVVRAYDTDWFRMPLVDPRVIWLQTVALGVGFALAAHVFVQRAVHRMDWPEALKIKE